MLARGQLRFADSSAARPEDAIANALAAFGLVADQEFVADFDEEFWLWPESEEAFFLWLALQSQWNWNFQRPVGLNYQGVEACMRLRGLRPAQRQKLFEMVQMMEETTLQVWSRQ